MDCDKAQSGLICVSEEVVNVAAQFIYIPVNVNT